MNRTGGSGSSAASSAVSGERRLRRPGLFGELRLRETGVRSGTLDEGRERLRAPTDARPAMCPGVLPWAISVGRAANTSAATDGSDPAARSQDQEIDRRKKEGASCRPATDLRSHARAIWLLPPVIGASLRGA